MGRNVKLLGIALLVIAAVKNGKGMRGRCVVFVVARLLKRRSMMV